MRSLRIFGQTAPPSLREGTPPNLGGDWATSITAKPGLHRIHYIQTFTRAANLWLPSILSWIRMVYERAYNSFAYPPAARSTWPPNFFLIADSIFSANVCSCRDRKRVYRLADRTSAGTASSSAAMMVQRPSPES